MKFVLGFFVLAYVIVFFNPKLVISYNGVPTNNFFCESFRRTYNQSYNGSRFIYDLQGTGIGTVVKIKCPICGAEEDITDIESW